METDKQNSGVKIGLALGSGSARGWSHIGILRALHDRGIEPTIVTGSSTGSLVAASYASDQLDAVETWARTLTKVDVWRLLDATLSGGGVMRGNRLMRTVGEHLEDRAIESLPRLFGAVAVDLYTGKEVWIQKGSMLHAVRASSGLPGLFTPMRHEDRWLIDGGVLNPVPVSMCRALGAEYVIAVNLNRPATENGLRKRKNRAKPRRREGSTPEEGAELFARWTGLLDNFVNSIRADREANEPGIAEVVYKAINIMQDQISSNRMIGDPPDLVVTPRLDHFHLMDFHRAAEAIEVGYGAVEKIDAQLEGIACRPAFDDVR
ncbi:MAG: patatin-like phospholipase RssA [Gammaproteobacteria bacterium]|nr:patatin-like phospholipase RssA [Gammaproteobacteria bacterium]MDH3576212.1 patatin-like phospholipase RssA [Gammaproteobacteria bacterium]